MSQESQHNRINDAVEETTSHLENKKKALKDKPKRGKQHYLDLGFDNEDDLKEYEKFLR